MIRKTRRLESMSKLAIAGSSSDLLMKVVIICDDIVFATKANAVLRSVGAPSAVKVVWEVKCWPLNALTDTALAAKALADSLDTHLIVLPASYARSVPTGLLDWLIRWDEKRLIHDAAIGFVAEGNSAGLVHPVSSDLFIFVQQHGLHLLIGQAPSKEGAMEGVGGSSSRSEKSALVGQTSFEPLRTHQSYRGMGIND